MRTSLPRLPFSLPGLLASLILLALPAMAHAAGHQVCNQTSYVIYLALGIPEADQVRSEGWTRLRPGQCRIVLPAPFSKRPYFAYGYSSPVHGGGLHQWGGRTGFCVKLKDNFSIDGKGACIGPEYQMRRFNVIDVHPPDGGKTILSEPAEYGSRAELAGIQRLLRDNGYRVRAVDGYEGRRTRAAIRKFLARVKISPRPDRPGLIDALEKAAQDQLASTGLHVCNKADAPVWIAYGRRQGRDWQSRGWWTVAPQSCTALLTGRFADKSVYVYAGLKDKGGERPLLMARHNFCVSDIIFAITGRQKCTLRGYQERPFALYKNDSGKGLTITLGPDDFSQSRKIAGLRQ